VREDIQNCGLVKYLKLQNMRKEVVLLEYMIGLWYNNEKAFRIGSHMIEIKIDDVYFLTGLSNRGSPILLFGHRSTPQPIEAYVAQYCVSGSCLVGIRIFIKEMMILPLRSILFDIKKLA
jgi:hypothetical protein